VLHLIKANSLRRRSLRKLSRRSSLKAFTLVLSFLSLAFLSACGGNKTASGVGCPGATGNYSASSLPAGSQWAYQLSGWFLSSTNTYLPYTAAGVFTVDGKGHITSGFDDYFGSSLSGTYSISGNGTGKMNVRLTSGSAAGNVLSWGLTLSGTNPGSMYLIEAEPFFNSSGAAYQQNVAAFATAPTGKFVFRTHVLAGGAGLAGSSASVGVMSVNAGSITALNEDVLLAGFSSQRTLGSAVANPVFTAPDSTGTGAVSFADSQGLITNYNYYVIDASDYLLFETDATNAGLGLGRMEAQSVPGAGFTNASLNGGYVFGSRGDTAASSASGADSVGQFAADGAGHITSGSYDSVRDGSPIVNAPVSSSGTASIYSVAANGRATVTLNTGGSIIQQTLYLVSGSRAFFVVNDNSRVEDGTIDQQASSSFSGGDFTGQFAFVNGGSVSNTPLDRTGTLTSDGGGNLGWAEIVNSAGSVNTPGCLSGSYTVATNGRVAASVNNLSGNLVFYLASPLKAYILQEDSASQVFGGAALQSGAVINPPGGF
jgi:hypothetical protein